MSPVKRVIVLLVCLWGASGCSWVFVRDAPRPPPRTGDVECTTRKVAPAFDTAGLAFQTGRVGYAAAQSESDYSDFPITRHADMAFGIALASIHAASMIYGYAATAECSRVKRLEAERRVLLEEVEALEKEQSTIRRTPEKTRAPESQEPRKCTHDAECGGASLCEVGRCEDLRR